MSAISSTTKKGVTLLEALFYIAILTFLMAIMVEVLVSMGKAYQSIKSARELEVSGTIAMDNMLREIRNASSVVLIQSQIDADPGRLTVSGEDENSGPYTGSFSISSSTVWVSKNGGVPAAITPATVNVSHLIFRRATSANSEGIRVELELSDSRSAKSQKFFGFAILRGSY